MTSVTVFFVAYPAQADPQLTVGQTVISHVRHCLADVAGRGCGAVATHAREPGLRLPVRRLSASADRRLPRLRPREMAPGCSFRRPPPTVPAASW